MPYNLYLAYPFDASVLVEGTPPPALLQDGFFSINGEEKKIYGLDDDGNVVMITRNYDDDIKALETAFQLKSDTNALTLTARRANTVIAIDAPVAFQLNIDSSLYTAGDRIVIKNLDDAADAVTVVDASNSIRDLDNSTATTKVWSGQGQIELTCMSDGGPFWVTDATGDMATIPDPVPAFAEEVGGILYLDATETGKVFVFNEAGAASINIVDASPQIGAAFYIYNVGGGTLYNVDFTSVPTESLINPGFLAAGANSLIALEKVSATEWQFTELSSMDDLLHAIREQSLGDGSDNALYSKEVDSFVVHG